LAAAAFFDVDGTIVRASIALYYVFFATRDFSSLQRVAWFAGSIHKILYYPVLDRLSRGRFNQVFYRNYRGMDAGALRALSGELFESVIRPRICSGAIARLQEHRAAGETPVLVTGSIDFVVAPLADYLGVSETLAVTLEERDGRFTGELTTPPISEEEKARVVRQFAAERRIDLARSHAYGDSSADLPMLRCVGHPVAVNPDKRLRKIAESEGWSIRLWSPPGRGTRAC
jgi:HAD superfamily hydrolase (TIGR01490 family)